MISRTAPDIWGSSAFFVVSGQSGSYSLSYGWQSPWTEAIVQIAFLRWQKDCMVFEVIFMGQEIARSDLLAVAESLK